ncbi:MAG TPA: CHAT domain-containing protein [Terriglobales bacterium]|nr:CHAT domain-containing protein [Terriglobales bacterium]
MQARALCASEKFQEGSRTLDDVQRSITDADQLLRAELEFARGECAFTDEPLLARVHYLKAANLAHGYDPHLESVARGDAGYVLMERRRADEAIQDFSAALATSDSPFLKQVLLGDLGLSYQDLGEWKTAGDLLVQAESIAAGIKDARQNQALWLLDLGRQHFSQLEYPDAKKSYSQALSIAGELHDSELKAHCLGNLAELALTMHDRASAEQAINSMEDLHPKDEQSFVLLLMKAELAALDKKQDESEGFLKEILAANVANTQLRWRAQSDLGTLYAEEGKLDDAEHEFQQAIASAENAFSDITSVRGRISFLDTNPFYDEYVRFLVMRNRPLDALNVAERGRSRALAVSLQLEAGRKGLNLRKIQENLRAKRQVVLAYWMEWNAESYLWVITPSRFKLLKLPSENEIVKEVDAYNQDILDHSAQDSPHGRKLYEMLVKPAQSFLPKGSNVIIVPHRRLFKLNFETLVTPSPKPHYWLEDACIQNTSFLAALENPDRERRTFSKQMLLMGAPAEASKDFPTLAHAPEELKQVEEHFPRSEEQVVSGAAATPAAYDSSDPAQFRLMHFVTHGTASDMNPLDSAIILSPSPQGFKLYARDIIKTKIHPELVTISTCYGAGTRQYSGEGLVGLAWAFMRAGAHQVIGALWEVDDAANAELMDHFYTALARTGRPAAALHEAKLAMLHSNTFHKRPYYWASLQLYTGR